jgi:hypothetical protein
MKKGDKLILFELTADDKYIDILLDSYNEIVREFKLNHEDIDLSGEIDINKSRIKWKKNKQISSNLKNKNIYEIADLNYKVSYKLPEKFVLQELNTLSNRYIFSYDESKVTITTSIKETNIYEYLNKNKDKISDNSFLGHFRNLKAKVNFARMGDSLKDSTFGRNAQQGFKNMADGATSIAANLTGLDSEQIKKAKESPNKQAPFTKLLKLMVFIFTPLITDLSKDTLSKKEK